MKTVWITKTSPAIHNPLPPGWQLIHEPVLNVIPVSTPPDPPGKTDILVFTSKNALILFSQCTDARHWPVYTVGDITAEAAREAGFGTIISAGKDVAALAQLIKDTPEINSRRMYYASGEYVSGDLLKDLQKAGYDIDRHIFYKTRSIDHVPRAIRAALENQSQLTVFLYSVNGARAFAGLPMEFKRIETVSLSQNVDNCLDKLGLKSRKIAEIPTEAALIKHLM